MKVITINKEKFKVHKPFDCILNHSKQWNKVWNYYCLQTGKECDINAIDFPEHCPGEQVNLTYKVLKNIKIKDCSECGHYFKNVKCGVFHGSHCELLIQDKECDAIGDFPNKIVKEKIIKSCSECEYRYDDYRLGNYWGSSCYKDGLNKCLNNDNWKGEGEFPSFCPLDDYKDDKHE